MLFLARFRVSADIGGTFSDLFVYDEDSGEIITTKAPTTPAEPALGLINALEKSKISIADMVFFSHGTTMGTNSLIERKIPRTALITTRGFRDVLEIRRANKQDIWDAYKDVAPPYVRRRDRLEVDERIDYSGKILKPLDEKEAKDVSKLVRDRRINAVAICFANSHMNGSNERRMKNILSRIHPEAYVCASHEIVPEIFEFERTSTTVINAALGPIMSNYMKDLVSRLRDCGYKHDVLIMHSAGGVMTAETAANFSCRLTNSGPTAGAAAVTFVAGLCGFKNAIGLDMGGTSADVSLTHNGKTRLTNEWSVEFGYPILFPCVDMVSIGAGGGSVAWIDSGGSLRNGPQSMGADPGPACYMKGGTEPTNTDANLVLERLSDKMFLGGQLKIDKEAAKQVIRRKIANPLGMDIVEAAQSIISIANANMLDAISLLSVRRGYDPREFVLVGFGGAGPLHVPFLAKELKIPRVLIPPHPGITSAMGCLLVDVRHDFSKTFICRANEAKANKIEKELVSLESKAVKLLKNEDITTDRIRILRNLDMRYLGQWRSLTVQCPRPFTAETLKDACGRFHAEHEREYMYSRREQEIEIYGLRVAGIGVTKKPKLKKYPRKGDVKAAYKGTRNVFFKETKGFTETEIYDRFKLVPGFEIEGPAIVEQMDSTLVIPPEMNANVDDYLNILMDIR